MLNPSPKRNILFKWFFWHFIEVPKSIISGWKNFLKFNLNYFSIFDLLLSLLSPWKGDTASYGRGFDAKRYLDTFLGNMISRILGAIIRAVIIVIGIVFFAATFLIGLAVLLVWIFLPGIFLAAFFYFIGAVV